jgi:hypothetical protein
MKITIFRKLKMMAVILGITKPLLATTAVNSKQYISKEAMNDFTIT